MASSPYPAGEVGIMSLEEPQRSSSCNTNTHQSLSWVCVSPWVLNRQDNDPFMLELRRKLVEVINILLASGDQRGVLEDSIESSPPKNQHHSGGRPTKYSASLAVKIGQLQVQHGLSLRETMELCSISRWSVWRWGKRYVWFGVLLNTIREARKRYPSWFCDGVLPHRKRRLFGTHSWAVKAGRPSKYQPSFARRVRPSVRQTAESLGIPRSTIHRWARQHFLEFGVPLNLARAKEDLKKLESAAGFR
jgi:hypothetical protein